MSVLRRYGPVALLALAVLATGWFADRIDGRGPSGTVASRHAPDFYMENFTTTVLDEAGAPSRRLTAEYMAHFPDTGTKEFSRPSLILYRDEGEPWRVESERGWVSADDDVMLLLGAVRIWRNSPAGGTAIEIRTEDLRVLPATDYGETDRPVVITTPTSESRGVGMRAWLAQSRLELLSQVRTYYEPRGEDGGDRTP